MPDNLPFRHPSTYNIKIPLKGKNNKELALFTSLANFMILKEVKTKQ